MTKADIDTNLKPHSTRAGSTSEAQLKDVPLQSIIRTAGWSKATVFAQYHDKPIEKEPKIIQEALLNTKCT